MNDHRDKNKDQDPLDEWLKDAACLPAADGSDQPAPAIWESIRTARAAQSRRRRLIIRWWMTGAVLVMGAIVLLLLSERRSTKHPINTPIAAKITDKKNKRSASDIQNSFSLSFFDQPLKPAVKPILKQPNAEQQNTQPAAHPHAAIALPEQALPTLPAHNDYSPDNTSLAFLPTRSTDLLPSQTAISLIIPSSWKVPVFFPAAAVKPASAKPSFYTGAHTTALIGTKQTCSMQAGWLAGYQINKHWSVETGVQYIRTRRLVQHEGRMRYRAGLTRTPDTPSLHEHEVNGMEDIETQLGAVTLRYTLSKGLDSPLPDQEWVRLSVQTREQNTFWRIPILLRYHSGGGRWYWTAAGGGGLNLPAGSSIEVESVDAPNGNVRSVRAIALGLRERTQTALLHGELQMAAGYRLGKHWSAELAPSLQFGSRQLYFRDAERSHIFTGGMQFRFLYDLK